MTESTSLRLIALGVMPLALACLPAQYGYTRTTQSLATARPASCAFDLYTTRPERSYLELGVLEPEPGGPRDGSIAEFREHARPQVCAAGGDAVLTEVNGFGFYVRGTVIKFKDGPAQKDIASAQVPPSAPRASAPAGMIGAVAAGLSTDVHSAPFVLAPVAMVLKAGQRFWVAPASTNGWRAAVLVDGVRGYVQDEQIQVEQSP